MARILGPDGQPIDMGLLKTTIATPTTTGVRQIIASASHGLDPELLGHMLRQAVNGDASAYLRLAEDMVGVGRWRYEITTGAVTWSDEIYRIHAIAPGAFSPKLEDVFSHYHEDDRAEIQRLVERGGDVAQGRATVPGVKKPGPR